MSRPCVEVSTKFQYCDAESVFSQQHFMPHKYYVARPTAVFLIKIYIKIGFFRDTFCPFYALESVSFENFSAEWNQLKSRRAENQKFNENWIKKCLKRLESQEGDVWLITESLCNPDSRVHFMLGSSAQVSQQSSFIMMICLGFISNKGSQWTS